MRFCGRTLIGIGEVLDHRLTDQTGAGPPRLFWGRTFVRYGGTGFLVHLDSHHADSPFLVRCHGDLFFTIGWGRRASTPRARSLFED